MSQNCTNTIKRIYVKVTNRNAHVYWLDGVPGSDTLTTSVKIESAGYVYPFSCNGATIVENKTYYFCTVRNGFFLEDDVEIITREEYIKETLNKEISKVRISDEATQMSLANFLCELYKALMNSINIISHTDYLIPEWIESTRQSFVKCNPNDIYFSQVAPSEDVDIELWVECARPVIFIGRGGENINYWRDLLQAYIDKWCEAKNYRQIKLGVRTKEKDLFKYESSVLSL